ncbi:MAG: RdgB/HAM1 family non-canonical purine NTP pyrophosphatase [Balneolaceae bacterium]
MDRLLIASANPHKVQELSALLTPLGISLVSLADLEVYGQVDEDAPTLEGNARKKAGYWFDKTGIPTLADDTGLEVEALGGEPGVRSARYAGEDATDSENVTKLLAEMKGVANRAARFRTVIALSGKEEKLFEGICPGSILEEPRGAGGFGYDPLFRPEGEQRSFAELTGEEKNRISHRGRALRNAVDYLKGLG